jgi:hypothetical protein
VYNPVLKADNATFTQDGQAGIGNSSSTSTSSAVGKRDVAAVGVVLSVLLSLVVTM